MKLSEALKATQLLYIETAPLIYYVEVNPAYIAKMDAVIAAVEKGTITAYSAVLTLTEVLIHPIREKNDALKRQYHSILVNNKDLQLLPITTRIAESAANLRARYNLRTRNVIQSEPLLSRSIAEEHAQFLESATYPQRSILEQLLTIP